MKKNSYSKSLALGGILAALTVLSVLLANIMPTNTLSLLALSSFFISIILMELGLKSAWTFYFATTLLSFIIVPDKTMVIPFISFFGIYGVIKHYIEKLQKLVLEYILKFAFFNANVFLAYFLINSLFESQALFQKYPLWIIFIALQVVFLIYDYVYTMFISYYILKLKKILKIN